MIKQMNFEEITSGLAQQIDATYDLSRKSSGLQTAEVKTPTGFSISVVQLNEYSVRLSCFLPNGDDWLRAKPLDQSANLLLQANTLGTGTGSGGLHLKFHADETSPKLFYVDQWDCRNVSEKRLTARFTSFLQYVAFWNSEGLE